MKTDLLPGTVQVDVSTDDELSRETSTVFVQLSLRVDLHGDPDVMPKLIDSLRDTLQPFATRRP